MYVYYLDHHMSQAQMAHETAPSDQKVKKMFTW